LEELEATSGGRVPMATLVRLIKPNTKPSAWAVERLEHAAEADLRWLSQALRDDARKWFVANTASAARSFSDALFEPMLLAGIEEVAPELNRRFVGPCMRVFGPQRVNEYLLSAIESGDDLQKAGAVNALVWAEVLPREKRWLA